MTHYRKDKIKRVLLKVINITSYILSLLFIIFAIYGCATSSNEGSQLQKANIQRRLDTKEEEEWNGINNYINRDTNGYYLYPSFITSENFLPFIKGLYSEYSGYTENASFTYSSSSGLGTIYYNYRGETTTSSFLVKYVQCSYSSTTSEYQYIRYINQVNTSTYPSINMYISINRYGIGNIQISTIQNSSSGLSFGWNVLQYYKLGGLNTVQITYVNNYIDSLEPPSQSGGSGGDMPIENTSLITLGDNFNPLALISDNLYNGGLIYYNTSASDNVLTLTGLSFESNGQTFDTIEITSRTCSGLSFSFDDGETILDVINGGSGLDLKDYHFFYRMKYSYNNDEVVVYPMQAQFENNGTSIYINLSRYKWINDEYRYLTIINDEETIIRNGMTTKELLLMRGSSTNAVIGAYNPVSILTGGFNALANLLNIAVLPGITLGLLLFIPLIVLVIITIFKMVKK